jgi:hypothetical protein
MSSNAADLSQIASRARDTGPGTLDLLRQLVIVVRCRIHRHAQDIRLVQQPQGDSLLVSGPYPQVSSRPRGSDH